MNRLKLIVILLVIFLAAGCSTVAKKSQVDVLEEFETIGKLDKAIYNAQVGEVNDYAPQGFDEAKTLLNKSIQLAQDGSDDEAVKSSNKGLRIIKKAETDANTAKKFMWEVSDYRNKAVKAGAPELYKISFDEAEELFHKTNSLIEEGKIEKAKENQPDLIQSYSDLEKNALEKGVVELAKMSFEQAKGADAEKYAPKYFQRAQKELNLAVSMLEADRTRTAQANEHAALASKLANKASQISELAKMFDRRDFTHEDIILWYWQQLEIINAPFEDEIDFEKANNIIVEAEKRKIANLKASYIRARDEAKNISMEAQMLAQKQQMEISEQQRAQAEKERMEREVKQKFIYIQSLFTPDEAQVYRKGDNVLISAQGFSFPSGKDEIQASNFGLLNKILGSINQFPKSKIEISGHTDSVGSRELNLTLSEKRAQNVANFITNVGRIPAERINFSGYGNSKPVASNKTEDGRAQNRRIELMIVNE